MWFQIYIYYTRVQVCFSINFIHHPFQQTPLWNVVVLQVQAWLRGMLSTGPLICDGTAYHENDMVQSCVDCVESWDLQVQAQFHLLSLGHNVSKGEKDGKLLQLLNFMQWIWLNILGYTRTMARKQTLRYLSLSHLEMHSAREMEILHHRLFQDVVFPHRLLSYKFILLKDWWLNAFIDAHRFPTQVLANRLWKGIHPQHLQVLQQKQLHLQLRRETLCWHSICSTLFCYTYTWYIYIYLFVWIFWF